MVDGEAPQAAQAPDPSAVSWQPLAKIAATVVAGAAWIEFVGGIVMWARLNEMGVAATPAVALLPKDLLFVIGVRSLALPLLAGAAAVTLLVLLGRPSGSVTAADRTCDRTAARDEESSRHGAAKTLKRGVFEQRKVRTAKAGNTAGLAPRGLWFVLWLASSAAFVVVVFVIDAGNEWRIPLAFGVILAEPILFAAIRRTDGFFQAAVALFIAVALYGGLISVARESETPDQDVAVVVRKDGSALGGFNFARTGDAVYLVTATPATGVRDATVKRRTQPNADQFIGDQRCEKVSKSHPLRTLRYEPRCYVPHLVGIPLDDVKTFSLGPRNVSVDGWGYRTARWLAQVALTRGEGERPKPKQSNKPKKVKQTRTARGGRGLGPIDDLPKFQ